MTLAEKIAWYEENRHCTFINMIPGDDPILRFDPGADPLGWGDLVLPVSEIDYYIGGGQ